MSTTVTCYDSGEKKFITSETLSSSTEKAWLYFPDLESWVPNRSTIKITQGNNRLDLVLYTGYHRCCGMREFGAVFFSWECTKEAKKALVAELYNNEWFNKTRVGALLYTKVKYGDETPADQYGWDFVDNWPGTVTEGGWWYNPNSGNYCCNVTLSFDAEVAKYAEEEED